MRYLPILWFLLVLAACQSKQTVMLTPSHAEQALPAVKNRFTGSIPGGTIGNLRQLGAVKVYGMNRYLDPTDSRLMHERHAVYRLEEQPVWITRSPRDQNEMTLGPTVSLPKPEYAPEPLPGETSREIFQARRGIQEATEGMKDLRESQEKLTTSMEAIAKNTAEAERKLTAVVSVLNERVKHLEGDGTGSANEQSSTKTREQEAGDVVVRSPNP